MMALARSKRGRKHCCAIVARVGKCVPLTRLCSIGDRRSWRQRNILLRLRFQRPSVLERAVSFQITVLKVLAGHPGGRASVADLTRFVSILMSSGPEWTNRTKRLAAHAPDLDIFGNAFVLRDDNGWQITDLGRRFLASLEVPIPATINQELPLA